MNESPTGDFPYPSTLVFEVTQACNNDCPHCYNAWKNPVGYPGGQLDTPHTLELLDKALSEMHVGRIALTGGEPMLRTDIYQIIDFLNDRGVEVTLITNGTLLDEAAAARLAPDKVAMFELPLLSCERDIHDRLSGNPGAFDRVTAAIADLKLAQATVVSVFVATKLNVHTFRETAEMAFALGADGLMLNRFNPGGRGRENVEDLQVPPERLQQTLDEAEAFSAEYEFPISCSIAMPPCLFDTERYERLTFGFCAAGTDRAYYTVDPVGHLRPCNHSTTILGNLRISRFRDLATSQAMKDFMSARPDFCADCRMEEECLGGCKAAAEVCCGSAWQMDPFLGAYHKSACKPG